jgi:hypothetical protein
MDWAQIDVLLILLQKCYTIVIKANGYCTKY